MGNSRPKRWKRVDGILLLDKPTALSSNTALQRARRVYSAEKAGHTGTLDPMATGLLPVCFGEATKFSSDLLDADKAYEALIVFGVSTTTGDAEGEVLAQSVPSFSLEQLQRGISSFLGSIEQIPPMYSALKRNGTPLYELARQGVIVEREPRSVIIYQCDLLEHVGNTARVFVRCSKGTYIRTLAMDLGDKLGCGAHLGALRRTMVGHLSIEHAVSLEELETVSLDSLPTLLDVDSLVSGLPAVELSTSDLDRFLHGNPVKLAWDGSVQLCRAYFASRFLGTGVFKSDGLFWPRRLLSQA